VDGLVDLGARFEGRVRVVLVYIAEAHPRDQWPIGDDHDSSITSLEQHATLDARRAAARLFASKLCWPFEVAVDALGDPFERAFAAWPMRLFVVHSDGATLAHVASPTPGMYTYTTHSTAEAIEALVFGR